MKKFACLVLVALFGFVASAHAQPLDCLKGTVDLAGGGTPAVVLTINGSEGDADHVVAMLPENPIEVFMQAPPGGPNPANFVLYVWLWEPREGTVTPQPKQLGDMCFPTPLTGGAPHPKKIWNNIGRYAQLGDPNYPSSPAPSTVFSSPSGLSSPLTVTFQGFILDDASAANKPASITNGVTLKVLWSLFSDMVFIPGGEFDMGCHAETGEGCESNELPVHAVYVDSFWMDIYEVTTQQYADGLNWALSEGELIEVTGGIAHQYGNPGAPYCNTTGSSPDSRITWDGTFGVVAGKEDHPMQQVYWYGAAAYANWRSGMEGRALSYDTTTWACNFDGDGYRIPTEAEWEYAARGGNHSPYYAYPWGNSIDGSNANFYPSEDPYETGPFPWTTPVGYYDGGQTPPGTDMANGYGLHDMAGNAEEWCNDFYSGSYYASSPYDNPRGPASGSDHVRRGGSWAYLDGSIYVRCAFRLESSAIRQVGFRVARY